MGVVWVIPFQLVGRLSQKHCLAQLDVFCEMNSSTIEGGEVEEAALPASLKLLHKAQPLWWMMDLPFSSILLIMGRITDGADDGMAAGEAAEDGQQLQRKSRSHHLQNRGSD